MRFILVLFIFLNTFLGVSQTPDALLNKLKSSRSDTATINVLNQLTDHYIGQNDDSANYFNQRSINYSDQKKITNQNFDAYYFKTLLKKREKRFDEASAALAQAFDIAKKTNNQENEARALTMSGSIFDAQNNGRLAIEKYLQALQLSKTIKNKKGILSSNISLGLYFKRHNESTNALEYFLEANKLATEMRDSLSLFTTSINLGSLYEMTNDKEKALKFYQKALKINERDNDDNGRAICSFKIGRIYLQQNKTDSAKMYLTETLNIHLKRNDEVGLIFDYSFIAFTFDKEGDHKKAKENWDKSLSLALKHNDSLRINQVYSYLAGSYADRKDYKKAEENYKLALNYISSTEPKETISMIYKKMSQLYADQSQYKQAYEYHVLFKSIADSSSSVIETKKQTELKLGYEFNQIQEKLMADSAAKELQNKAELEKQHLQRNFLLLGLGLISLMLLVAFRSYRMKQKANAILEKQKIEIEHQKKLVDEKNREISDSINYALRIQTASLPEKNELSFYFNTYNLFFKPKDVVSGDFYWAAGDENKVVLAIGDCTGHGVPGAITSMIGSMLLNEIYYVKKITQPDEVLKELNRLVKLTLRQENDSLSKDGMDMAICQWDKKTNTLLYSGANRPMYILRGNELIEHKPTKVSVGGYVPLIQNYDLNTFELRSGDKMVLTTDGFADQFGGTNEKKFTTKAFKILLKETSQLSLSEQSKIIEDRFHNWKNDFEQTDDILVFILQF
jgi:serine phosphatase RsbU (regulator of sigma subunit)